MVFAFCFALNIPLDLVQRVQLGLQQGFRMNLWQACGSVAGLAGVVAGNPKCTQVCRCWSPPLPEPRSWRLPP